MTARLLHELLDRRAAQNPKAPALVHGGRCWTYDELRAASQRLASALRARGVRHGDRVLIVDAHDPLVVALLSAVSRCGAIHIVLSAGVQAFHLSHIIADSEPALILVGGPARGSVREALPDPATVSVVDLEALRADLEGSPDGTFAEEHPAAACGTSPVSLIYTSGSTAMPKAVVSTHAQVLFAAEAIASRLDYRADDRVLLVLPLSFDYGLYQVHLCALAGACLVLGEPEDAGPRLPRVLRENRVTVLPVVPAVAAALARLAPRAGGLPSDLRLVTNTGASLTPAAAEALREAKPDLAVVAMFGLTECKRVSIETPNSDRERPGSVGHPLPGTEAHVIGEDGRRLPAGQVGELVVRGPHVMSGYWRAPELTAQRFVVDEFGERALHTGDQCWLDEQGRIHFAGRVDDVYKQDGFRVSAVEVENAALDIDDVDEAALLLPQNGVPARLTISGSLTTARLRRELARRLDPEKLPSRCSVLSKLPHSVNGKIDKKALEALL